jgi:hemerythrin-like domain-containing protein
MEDKVLYPRLAEAKGEESSGIALAFQQEMGGLAQAFADYNQRWQATRSRATRAASRARRTPVLLIGRRIARENNELYPLADRIL